MEFWNILKMMGNKIQNLGAPVAADDAATKQYVDDHITDPADAHDAASVSFDPTGLEIVVATNTQDAIEELDDELDAHEVDTSDAHDASAISVNPAGTISATDVQAALEELASEAATDQQNLADHLADPTDAHDAAAISVMPVGTISATDVQAALAELASDAATDAQNLVDHIADPTGAHAASAISFTPVGDISASDVQAALAELSAEKATIQYVDDRVAGLSWKAPARAATTADITLSGEQTIDGVAVVANDRVLVKDQTLSEQNGIYVAAVGAWSRSTDANTAAEILQASVFVQEGTVNGDRAFVLTTNAPLVLNTTPLTFTPFGFSGTPTGPAGGVLSGTYPNPGFAVDMATQAELDAHIGDTSDAHDASAVSVVPTGSIASTDVQSALAELDTEKQASGTVPDHDHDNATPNHGGVLTNDAHDGFSDYAASGVPSNPAADHLRYAVQTLSSGGGATAPFGLEKTPTGGLYTDGQDTWFMGWNSSAAVIKDKGRAVYLSTAGADGIGAFGMADARFSNSLAFGILAENVAPLAMGRALVKGLLLNIDTSTMSAGGPVYLSTVPNSGILTGSPPSGQTDYTQRVGTCLRSHLTTGVIWIDIQYFGVSHSHSGSTDGGDDLFPRVIGPNSFTTAAEVGGANRNNWDPGGSFQSNPTTVVLLTSATLAFNLTGIVAPTFVSSIWIHFFNLTSVNVTINNQNGNSSATNRIITPDGRDFILKPNESVWMLYVSSGGLNRWVISATLPKWNKLIGPPQITAQTDNWSPTDLATALIIRFSTDASTRALTGLMGGTEGRFIILQNAGSFDLIIRHDSASSVLGNRFITPGGVDYRIRSNESVVVAYDSAQTYWRIVQSAIPLGTLPIPSDSNPSLTNPYVSLLDPHDEGPIASGGFEPQTWTHPNFYSNAAIATEYARNWFPLGSGVGSFSINKEIAGIVPAVVNPSSQLPINALRGLVTTIDASITGGDFYSVITTIEGWKWAAYAQRPFTIGFWVRSSLAGIYTVCLRNAAGNQACVLEYTINAVNTYEYKTLTFPASPSAGTWNYGDGIGVYLFFNVAVGSSLHTTPGAWVAANLIGTANQVNWMATGGNSFYLWGVKGALGNFVSQYKTPDIGHGTYGAVGMQNPYVTMLDPHNDGPIINGGMNVAQRGNVTAIGNAAYGLDMWQYSFAGAMVVDMLQDAIAPPPVSNYGAHYTGHSLLIDVNTADASIAAAEMCMVQQNIEGYVWAPYAGRQFTIGFWVKSTVTGIYCVTFRGGGSSYIAEYTIVTSNTWEYKTITVPPHLTGAWVVNNGIGITISFMLAAGTGWHAPANFWWGGTFLASPSQVNAVNSTSNFFSLWGVKINLGPYVTPYVARPQQQELALCRRYLYRITAPGGNYAIVTGQAYAATLARMSMTLPVPMRIAPGLSISGAADFWLSTANYGAIPATTAVNAAGGMSQGTEAVTWDATVAAGLVAGSATNFSINGTGKWMQWSAEM